MTTFIKENNKVKEGEESQSELAWRESEVIRQSILDETLNCEANINSSQDIPVIDASPILQYGQDQRPTKAWLEVVATLERALTEVGFLSLANHGIDAQRAKEASQAFFLQTVAEKMQHAQRPDFHFGYTAEGAEKLYLSDDVYDEKTNGQKLGDPKESLNIPPLHMPWQWPASSAQFNGTQFRETMTDYFHQCERFTLSFLKTLAHVLGEEQDFFDAKMHDHMSVVRALNYPAIDTLDVQEDGGMRASAHTDFGLLTLLQTFGIPGLQVQNMDGEWINVVLQDPNDLVVNIGDALSRMTNGVFKSTRHRVAQLVPIQRQSIPYFVNFNEKALIEPVRKYRKSAGNYPAVASGTYIYYKNGLAMGFEKRTQEKNNLVTG
jgi:isopenicillin N synthase-like dioxygenase